MPDHAARPGPETPYVVSVPPYGAPWQSRATALGWCLVALVALMVIGVLVCGLIVIGDLANHDDFLDGLATIIAGAVGGVLAFIGAVAWVLWRTVRAGISRAAHGSFSVLRGSCVTVLVLAVLATLVVLAALGGPQHLSLLRLSVAAAAAGTGWVAASTLRALPRPMP